MIAHGCCDENDVGRAHELLSGGGDDLGSASGNGSKTGVEIDGDAHHCHDRADADQQCWW